MMQLRQDGAGAFGTSGTTTQGGSGMAGVSLKRIMSVLLPILALIGWMVMHSNFLMGRALWLAFPDIESTYKGAWPTFTGSIVASDVTVYPFGDPDDALHFDRVRVEIPMFQWYISAFYKRSNAIKPISRLRVVLDGARSEGDVGFTSQLLAFGDASASPFEAEGCAEDGMWLRNELYQMDLNPGPTRLALGYRVESGKVIMEQSLETPGVSRVHAVREIGVRGKMTLLSLREPQAMWLESDRWTIQDEGFVAARNGLCGRRDGVAPEIVGRRHAAVLQRLLATQGVQLGGQAAALYRRFGERGGALELDVRYLPSLNEVYDNDFGDWLPHLRGTLALDGQRVDLGLRQIPPQPVSDRLLESEDTMLMAMYREGSLPTALLGPLAPSDTALALENGTPQSAPGDDQNDDDEIGAEPVLQPAALARLSRRAPGSGDTASAPAPATPAPDAPRAMTQQERRTLGYRDLLRLVGSRVRVHSTGSRPRVVEIVAVERGVVKVRQRAGAGWAQYDLSNKTFVRAELMP